MRRILPPGLVVFAGMISVPAAVSTVQAQLPPRPSYQQDSRLATLREFFQADACPAAEYAETFLEAADDYNLDWRLLPSISYVESTGGKLAHNNNFFGWDGGNAEFASPAAGIHEVGYRLAHSTLYREKSLDALLTTYNPEDKLYVRKVKRVMRRIADVQ